MVDVCVCDDDLLHLQIVLLDQRDNLLDVVPRVDDNCLARLLVADDGAIALKGADWEDLVDHKRYFSRGGAVRGRPQRERPPPGEDWGGLWSSGWLLLRGHRLRSRSCGWLRRSSGLGRGLRPLHSRQNGI